jgi:tetratricopeptide (TPR) repeat protein
METNRAQDIPTPDKPENTSRVETHGGAFIDGGVDTGGGAFIGRDQYVIYLQTPQVGPEEAQDIEDLLPEKGDPPYQGLQYFDEKDADRFFGRELLTARIIARLHRTSFLAVVGASGSGKSSVIRAGVIPALRRGQRLEDGGMPPTDSAKWLMRTFTPTSHPVEALAAVLTLSSLPQVALTQLNDDLLKSPQAFASAVRRLLAENQARHLLLFVDQFEEVFTLCRSPEEREAFLGNLLAASGEEDAGQVTVLLALRADYYAQVAQHDGLREAIAEHQEFIGAMSRDDLVRAVDRPLAQGNWKIQKGLIEVILDDIGYEPGALPLLSHALHETWIHRRGRTLTLSSYTEAGGVHGAIAKTAEAVFQHLPEEQQPVAQLIFLRMAEVGEASQDTRRRATYSELITRSTDELVINTVIKILTDARLVITDTVQPGDTRVVEVAHEALIREWPRLCEWLDEDRQSLILHQHLTEASSEWIKMEHDPDVLYRGTRLQQATTWSKDHPDAISLVEQEFLEESRKQAEIEAEQTRRLARAKRQQRIFIAVTAVLLVAVAYLAYTYFFTKTPAVMNGLYNIAIAGVNGSPVETAGSNASGDTATAINDALYASLSKGLGDNPNILIWHDSPDLREKSVIIGPVTGSSPGERQAAVASLAQRLHADMVIFGNTPTGSGSKDILLSFFLAPQLDTNDEDVQGSFDLGCAVSQKTLAETPETEASSCVNGLAWIALGLSEAHLGHSLEALEAFQSARQYMPESALLWFLIGREYLFLVDRESVLEFARGAFEEQAELAFTRSAELDPGYARARIGLGSTYLKRARQLLENYDHEAADPSIITNASQLIDQSLAAYQRALELSSGQESDGLPLDSVARLGLGNGLRLKGEVYQKQGLNEQAIEQFDQAIAMVEQTVQPLQQSGQQRYLTQAYEYLGTAYQWKAYTYLLNQDYEQGMPAYQQAQDYYDRCIAQGKGTQDLIIRNDIIKNVCQPNRDSIQQELDNLGGAQG